MIGVGVNVMGECMRNAPVSERKDNLIGKPNRISYLLVVESSQIEVVHPPIVLAVEEIVRGNYCPCERQAR